MLRIFYGLCILLISTHLYANCEEQTYKSVEFIVCTIPKNEARPIFIWQDESNKPFKTVSRAVKRHPETFLFLMNGGMYHHDLAPVGLFIENFQQRSPISTKKGPGNFHLMPNGIFYINEHAPDSYQYHVSTTEQYLQRTVSPKYATQSGPMLVIDNKLHPKFIPNSDSKFIRNGVGVDALGQPYFVITKQIINFYDFASFFKDVLKTPNALYLDGKISTLYAPPFKTISSWFSVGPMIGAVKIEN